MVLITQIQPKTYMDQEANDFSKSTCHLQVCSTILSCETKKNQEAKQGGMGVVQDIQKHFQAVPYHAEHYLWSLWWTLNQMAVSSNQLPPYAPALSADPPVTTSLSCRIILRTSLMKINNFVVFHLLYILIIFLFACSIWLLKYILHPRFLQWLHWQGSRLYSTECSYLQRVPW